MHGYQNRGTPLLCALLIAILLQVCDADRDIIINEDDFYGSCRSTCDSIGEVFDRNGCTKISGCQLSSVGWTRGFVRCDYCVCNCEEDVDDRDVTIENKPISLEEYDLYGICTGTCDETGGLLRTDYAGCQEVRDCRLGTTGYVSGFVRCDYCTCTCINRRYAQSYELKNIQYDTNGIQVANGKPTALAQTILVNKDSKREQMATATVEIKHSETTTVETSETLEVGLLVTVSAGINIKIVDLSTQIQITGTNSYTYTAGSSKTEERTYSATPTIRVPPSSTVTATISGSVMKIDVPYTADRTTTYEDGTKSSAVRISGIYRGVKTGRFTITYDEPIALGTCPEGWDAFNRTCYIFDHLAEKTFEQATVDCSSRGAILATIHSRDEQLFLIGLMEHSIDYVIGLNDRANEDTFVWSDGTQLDYTNWAPDQPDDFLGNEDCVVLPFNGTRKYNRQWIDVPCNAAFAYICQQKAKATGTGAFLPGVVDDVTKATGLTLGTIVAIAVVLSVLSFIVFVGCGYRFCCRRK